MNRPITKESIVLVVGATSGIGRCVSELLATGTDAPQHIYITGRRVQLLEEIALQHPNITGIEFDSSKIDGINKFVDDMFEKGVTHYVISAGIQRMMDYSDASNVDLEVLDLEMKTNFTSPAHFITQIIARANRETPSIEVTVGIITSGLAMFPIPRSPGYSASKAAMRAFLMAVRRQLEVVVGDKNGVKIVEIIAPAVETELHDAKHQPALADVGPIGIPLLEYATDLRTRLATGVEDEIAYDTSILALKNIGSKQRYMCNIMPTGATQVVHDHTSTLK